MCFYTDDCDWYPSVVDRNDVVAAGIDTKRVCMECGEIIQSGARYVTIYQQEHEECQNDGCEDGCQCGDPDFGETYDYWCCDGCDKFIRAIEQAETEAGCHPVERRPLLEELFVSLHDLGTHGDARESKKYVKKAIAMFPELKGYFRKHWWRIVGC